MRMWVSKRSTLERNTGPRGESAWRLFHSMRGSAQLNYIDSGGALQSTAVMILLHV